MNKKYFLLHQKAEEDMKCKVKANYLEVNGQKWERFYCCCCFCCPSW